MRGAALAAIGAAAVAALCLGSPAQAQSRQALWTVVRACALAQATFGVALPCRSIETAAGVSVAVVDPPLPQAHTLVVPTDRVIGVEAEPLAGAAGANYAALAWRTALGASSGRWDGAGMVVNSARVRSQDQLHVHVDCLSPRGRGVVARLLPAAQTRWRRIGRDWFLATDASAGGFNPFALIRQIPGEPAPATVNVAVLGVMTQAGAPGYLVLANTGRQSYENLLQTSCGAPSVAKTSGAVLTR
ncbi:CDP-diacylglycerol diphosphatase [Alsobacter soli]|uniref:CDP-diacylglycerol diphosphatase n=1 Tax=Alsobacter soli TaxID=2109933 RepID=UPI001304F8DD|nr:CDP-diacylglycerol diphosphatase [Alsobacter soli]